jgi:hypothetical protein
MPRIARGEAAAIGDLPQAPVDLPQERRPERGTTIEASLPVRRRGKAVSDQFAS